METQWEFLTKTIYDPAIFWAMFTAVMTGLLFIVTGLLVWVGVIPLVRTRRAELAEHFREELVTPSAQRVLFLASHGLLSFVTDPTSGNSYFTITQASENAIEQRLRQILVDQRIVLTFEMDDALLSPLQQVAYYEARGAIDFDEAFRVFGSYVDICMSNLEIRRYLQWVRQRGATEAYLDLERLYTRMNDHNETLHPAAR